MASPKPPARTVATVVFCHNRKARFNYAFDEELEAGVVLSGTEVKACRAGRAHLNEAYVQVKGRQAYLIGGHIAEYAFGNRNNHATDRERKLLLHRRQIDRLQVSLHQQGLSAIPIALAFVGGRVKCTIGVGRGKKAVDRRRTIAERESKREVQRQMRQAQRGGRGGDND